ncbi:MAG: AAC(3) family N-acetyltransferase [Rhizobiaceae bacterium]|nr:AAC(3) family N-acetyltransferase [Rhizobiaceae bacterium]
MIGSISQARLETDIEALGVRSGDTILLRASPKRIGTVEGGGEAIIEAFLKVLGTNGTLVSLAYTDFTIRQPDPKTAFHRYAKSYAGAVPNRLLCRDDSFRSAHPTNSVVAVGMHARQITEGHDEKSPAYEPIRRLIDLDAKFLLVGCVKDSPGFTTTHLAEFDNGLHKLVIFPKLSKTYFRTSDGALELFRRPDLGLCSNSYVKLYSRYVLNECIETGYIGNAYSLIGRGRSLYDCDVDALKENPRITICGNPTCLTCNARRWDNIHKLPFFLMRRLIRGQKNESA